MALVKLCEYTLAELFSLCDKAAEAEDLLLQLNFFSLSVRLVSCSAAPGAQLPSVAAQPLFASDE